MLLAVTPDVFDRIEFRCIGGQKLQFDLTTLSGDKLPHQTTAMNWKPIPDDRQFAADMPLKMLQELDDLRSFDAAGEEPEVEIPDRNARHGRKALPVKRVLKHGCLAAWRPGSHPVRPFAQAALVHKDYGALLLEGFFFISGQRTRFQRRIAGSSRWVALPTGRWQLQLSDRRIFQTCPG